MKVEFYFVRSYNFDARLVLCIVLRIDGLLHVYFTSDGDNYDQWIQPLRAAIPPDNMEAIDDHAEGLARGEVHCGTRIVTGWAAMAIAGGLSKYDQHVGSDVMATGWDLPPNTMETHQYLTRTSMANIRERGDESMVELGTPQDVIYIFTGERGYRVGIVFAVDQIAELATRFEALSNEFLTTVPLVQTQTELPATSDLPVIVFGEDPWIDEAAAALTCMWIRVSRTVAQMR